MRRRLLASMNAVETGPIDINNYLTIEALEDGLTVALTNSSNRVKYCINGDGEWLELDAGVKTQEVNIGDTLSFKCSNPTVVIDRGIGTFAISKKCNLKGNCISMLYSDSAVKNSTIYFTDAFSRLFASSPIIAVSENFLPATTLAIGCYDSMFSGCSSLTTAPALPATTLASSCYANMFYGCSSLTTAPALPATTLASSCYANMFYGCSSLTTAPDLPATTLAGSCCYQMFYRCSSLTTAPALPATTLADGCYDSMFRFCSSLTTASDLPATTLANSCYHWMFYGCSSLTTAPDLPATTLAIGCYGAMFYGCSSLTTAPDLPATTLVDSCYASMFSECSSLTTAPALPATTLADLCYSYMFSGCRKLNYVKMLAIDISGSTALSSWLDNVSSSGVFVKNKNATWDELYIVPDGWTIEYV